MSELQRILEAAGIEAALARRLSRYGTMLLEANLRVNLSGARTPAALLPHLLDSLSAAPYVQSPLVDVGSGGGLPAIPLAIATGIPVTMIESTAKKSSFLRTVVAEMGLDAAVVSARAEEAGRSPEFREHFASGTARAVSSAPTVAELLLPLLEVGGLALLQRGAIDERERNAVSDACAMLGGELAGEAAAGGDRRILLIRKVAATPQRFPRRTGIPEKRPLCR